MALQARLFAELGIRENIGITTTIPIEVILAAGHTPVDLNNVFINEESPVDLVLRAESRGFPANLCAWIKGIYGVAEVGGLRRVIGVVRGDCSSTEKLLEVWRHEGLETHSFAYPFEPDPVLVEREISSLCETFGASLADAEKIREGLSSVRSLLRELDEMTWKDGRITGYENHLWLVTASDFNRDPKKFEAELRQFMEQAEQRPKDTGFDRLGYVGVPPIVSDLYQYLEKQGAQVVFNEVQRQFAMIGGHQNLAEQYASYTYPYDTFLRIRDIKQEIERRALAGIIHYAQTFCHRQIESMLLKERLPVPVLTIEADKPGPIDARTRTRIDAFLEQVRGK